MNDSFLHIQLDNRTAGWLVTQMELVMQEYTDQAIDKEFHASDKAEAFRVAANAGHVLTLIHEALAAREGKQ